jgi:hypothetical protein
VWFYDVLGVGAGWRNMVPCPHKRIGGYCVVENPSLRTRSEGTPGEEYTRFHMKGRRKRCRLGYDGMGIRYRFERLCPLD